MSNKREFFRTIKFTLFSISAGIIELVSFSLFNEVFNFNYWVSYLIALMLSVIWNFTLNRKITFCSANNVPIAMLKVAGYYLVFTPLSTWWTAYLTSEKVGINEYIVLAGTMLINLITEYLFQKYVVFRGSIDSAKNDNNT